MSTPRPYMHTLLTMLCIASAGCGSDAASPHMSIATCSSDAECEPSLTCREQRCTVAVTDDRDLSFMFIPPSSSVFLPQRTPYYSLDPGERLDFALEPSVSVYGQIGSFNASGTLVFTPSGTSDPVLRQQTPVELGTYVTALLPGTYHIDFISSTDGIPNRAWRNVLFETDVQHDLPLPDLSQTVSITGNVNFLDPTVNIGSGLGPARVTAVSRTTGVLSTSVVTDSNTGFYEGLRIWRSSGIYDVVVSPTNDDALVPTVTFRGKIDTDDIPANASSIEYNLFVGDFAVAERVVRLELDEAAEDRLVGISPGDLAVQLTAKIETGSDHVDAAFNLRGSIAATADESSPLAALPLRYIGEIVPPAGSRYARTPIELDLRSISARVIKLPAPTELDLSSAIIRTYRGDPAEGARVTFTPRSPDDGSVTSRSIDNSRAFEVVSNADGEIAVWLEPDVTYDMRVDSMSLDAPRAAITIQGDALPPVFALPSPSLISGSVWANDASGSSIAGVTVRVLERDDDVERVIAEGQTDANGAFRLIAPDDASGD